MKRSVRPKWLIRWQRAYYVAFALSLLLGGPSLSEEIFPGPEPESATGAISTDISLTPSDPGQNTPISAAVPLTAPFPGMGVPLRTSVPPPAFLSAPHPFRAEIGDLKKLLRQAGPEELTLADECANEMEAKPDRLEAESKIRANPLKYHWCFYKMVLNLEETVRITPGYFERKQTVIATYSRLVVLAQAFKSVFRDRRYVEFAGEHYRQLNEYLFSRKLVATKDRRQEEQTDKLSNPFPGWRPPSDHRSVLGKYGIRPEPLLKGVSRTPAAESTP